jgi:WD40 repeat protein
MKRITLDVAAPYVGLRPFTEQEALLFFGRQAHVQDLLGKLQRKQRLVAVLGVSGSGKSSLVRAGLIPALHRGALVTPGCSWTVCAFTPGDAPLDNLAHALVEDARWIDDGDVTNSLSSLRAGLSASPLALADLYKERASVFGSQALLLVVDQFEEIFRYRQRSADEAESFIKLLLRSSSEDVAIHVVLTMRSDFLGNCVAFFGLPEAINSGMYLTPRLGSEELKSVIASPLALAGGEIDAVLVNRLVNTLGGEDELPILQHALLRMWNRAKDHRRMRIERADFQAVCAPRDEVSRIRAPGHDGPAEPTLAFAIDNHASEIYTGLTPEQQKVARRLFLALVERRDGRDIRHPQKVRQLIEQVGEEDRENVKAVIEAFRADGAGFLLPPVSHPLDDEAMVDIIHESLFRQWHLFQYWLAEETVDVAELKEWQQRAERREKGGGGWLDDSDCQRAQRWRERVDARGSPVAWAARYGNSNTYAQIHLYIQSSLDRKMAEEQRIREAAAAAVERRAMANRSRRLWAAVGGLVVLLLATLYFAQEARYQRKAAEEASTSANVLRLAAEGSAMLKGIRAGGDERAIQQILAAHALAVVPETSGALLFALTTLRNTLKIIHIGTPILSIAVSPDGTFIVSGADDRKVRLWHAESGQLMGAPFTGHESTVASVAVSPDSLRIASGSFDDTLRIWDAKTGAPVGATRKAGAKGVLSVAFSPDGSRLVSGGGNGKVQLWLVTGGPPIWEALEHTRDIRGAAFSADGSRIATCSDDGTIRLWDANTGRQVRRALVGHKGPVWSVAFNRDASLVLSGGDDTTLRLWDVRSGQQVKELRGHTGGVFSIAISRDGTRIVSGSNDRTLRLWDARTGEPLGDPLEGHKDTVQGVAFNRDESRLVSGGHDGTLRIWDAETDSSHGPMLGALLQGHLGQVWSVAFAADGSRIVSGGGDGTLRIWDAKSDRPLSVRVADTEAVLSVALSANGLRIVSGGSDGTLRLWDAVDGHPIGKPAENAHHGGVRGLAFSPDKQRVVSSGDDGLLRFWDIKEGEQSGETFKAFGKTLTGHKGTIWSVAYSPDGSRIVSGGDDHELRLWDAETGQQLGEFRGHSAGVWSVTYSPDGSRIASGGNDGTVRLWDVRQRQSIGAPLEGHQGTVLSVAFSPDGSQIISGGWDRTIRLWDAKSGQPVGAPLEGHIGSVQSLAFERDSARFVSGSADKTLRIWAGPKMWREMLCAKLIRNVSDKQWKNWISPVVDYRVQCPQLPIPS